MNYLNFNDVIETLENIESTLRNTADFFHLQKGNIINFANFFTTANIAISNSSHVEEVEEIVTVEPPLSVTPDEIIATPRKENPKKEPRNKGKTRDRLSPIPLVFWRKIIYDVLHGNQYTRPEIFKLLVNNNLLRIKKTDLPKRLDNLKQALYRLEKDGDVRKISNKRGAPWIWIGGPAV